MPSQTLDEMRSFVGKDVTIVLNEDEPEARVTGVLHWISDDGEVKYEREGKVFFGWPCLAVEPTDTVQEGL